VLHVHEKSEEERQKLFSTCIHTLTHTRTHARTHTHTHTHTCVYVYYIYIYIYIYIYVYVYIYIWGEYNITILIWRKCRIKRWLISGCIVKISPIVLNINHSFSNFEETLTHFNHIWIILFELFLYVILILLLLSLLLLF